MLLILLSLILLLLLRLLLSLLYLSVSVFILSLLLFNYLAQGWHKAGESRHKLSDLHVPSSNDFGSRLAVESQIPHIALRFLCFVSGYPVSASTTAFSEFL